MFAGSGVGVKIPPLPRKLVRAAQLPLGDTNHHPVPSLMPVKCVPVSPMRPDPSPSRLAAKCLLGAIAVRPKPMTSSRHQILRSRNPPDTRPANV